MDQVINNQPDKPALDLDIIGGIIMIISAIIALFLASSIFAEQYKAIINIIIPLDLKFIDLSISFKDFVQEILMAIFFLQVGMELKKEIYQGVLSERNQVVLPLFAAFGGMVMPAVIYMIINWQYPEYYSGVAVPCETDIAFAICVFNLIARSVPISAKIFLLSIAIFDDVGAILLIAFFYNNQLALLPLALVLIGTILLIMLNHKKIVNVFLYFILAVFIGSALHTAGIHSTITGVILGFAIPLQNKNNTASPLNEFIKAIHPWNALLILPIFAFIACDVNIMKLQMADILHPVSLGVTIGLIFGKQIGVFGFSWLLIKSKIVSIPQNCNWLHMYFISCLCGIGFTVCLFVNELAFDVESTKNLAKAGIIFGTVVSAMFGITIAKLKKL